MRQTYKKKEHPSPLADSIFQTFLTIENLRDNIIKNTAFYSEAGAVCGRWCTNIGKEIIQPRVIHHVTRVRYLHLPEGQTLSAGMQRAGLGLALHTLEYYAGNPRVGLQFFDQLTHIHMRHNKILEMSDATPNDDNPKYGARIHELMTQCMMALQPLLNTMSQLHAKRSEEVTRDDAFQQIQIGALEALHTWTTSLGVDFITHLYTYIRKNMSRYFETTQHYVRLPTHLYHLFYQLKNMEARYELEHGAGTCTPDVLCALSGQNLKTIQQYYYHPSHKCQMLDHGDEHFDGTPPIDETTATNNLKERMAAAINELDPVQQQVIRLAFGFNGHSHGEEVQYTQLAKQLNMSYENVLRIKNAALAALKKKLKRYREDIDLLD